MGGPKWHRRFAADLPNSPKVLSVPIESNSPTHTPASIDDANRVLDSRLSLRESCADASACVLTCALLLPGCGLSDWGTTDSKSDRSTVLRGLELPTLGLMGRRPSGRDRVEQSPVVVDAERPGARSSDSKRIRAKPFASRSGLACDASPRRQETSRSETSSRSRSRHSANTIVFWKVHPWRLRCHSWRLTSGPPD